MRDLPASEEQEPLISSIASSHTARARTAHSCHVSWTPWKKSKAAKWMKDQEPGRSSMTSRHIGWRRKGWRNKQTRFSPRQSPTACKTSFAVRQFLCRTLFHSCSFIRREPKAQEVCDGDASERYCVNSTHLSNFFLSYLLPRRTELRQAFNTFDPSPFFGRDLDPDAESFLIAYTLGASSHVRE